MEKLTKKEKRELEKEEWMERRQKEKRMRLFKKWGIILGVLLLISGIFFWLIKESSKPLPGAQVTDLGRDHVSKEQWQNYKYNSNPPTSGPHDAVWTKPGIYEHPQGDGHLIHSLEHGYVIISYNCMKLNSKLKSQNSKIISNVYAHEGEEESGSTSTGEKLEGVWESKECKNLIKQLTEIANEQRLRKLIVVSRPKQDVSIALTAWTRIEKLQSVDKGRIVTFINAFRNKGPEATME